MVWKAFELFEDPFISCIITPLMVINLFLFLSLPTFTHFYALSHTKFTTIFLQQNAFSLESSHNFLNNIYGIGVIVIGKTFVLHMADPG